MVSAPSQDTLTLGPQEGKQLGEGQSQEGPGWGSPNTLRSRFWATRFLATLSDTPHVGCWGRMET